VVNRVAATLGQAIGGEDIKHIKGGGGGDEPAFIGGVDVAAQ